VGITLSSSKFSYPHPYRITYFREGSTLKINEKGWVPILFDTITDTNGPPYIFFSLRRELLPKVLRACAIGVPDDRLIEVGMVFIELKQGETASEQDMIDYCKGRIAPFKVPRYVRFTHDFPMTGSGKIQKFVLRENVLKELGLDKS
jgi:acyl-CoA synthetase (AMP-forming)/AMP-acid ligase II